jgi:Flp pilus assembly pilin Flp
MSGLVEGADVPDMTSPGRIGRIRSSRRREEGQTMAEYAVVLAIITPAIVLAFGGLGDSVASLLDSVRGLF